MVKAMNDQVHESVEGFQTTTRSLMEKCQAFDPLPTFSSATSNDYLEAMTANNCHTKLASAVKNVEMQLDDAKAFASELGIPIAHILPEIETTESAVKRFLGACWVTTSLRILSSRPARNLSVHLKEGITKTIEFSQGLDVPEQVVKQLKELEKKITKASGANPRARSRSR